jgi:hypothetical protein
MKNLFICLILFTLIFPGCGSEKKVKTFTEILDENNAYFGKQENIYRCALDKTNMDGSYVIVNFHTIMKYMNDTLKDGTLLNNAVVIQNASDMVSCSKYLKDISFFSLIDDYGNKIDSYTARIFQDEYCYIVIQFKEDISSYKYLLAGEFDRTRYDSSIFIFTMIDKI